VTVMMMPVPGKSFQIAGVLALSGILAAMASGLREPTPAPAAITTAVAKPVFAERFDLPDEPALLKKADRLVIEQPGSVPVKTETILMTKPDAPVEAKGAARKRTAGREVAHDICARHHMHRAWVTPRRWRCRR
jgi:hypothetical protein